MQYAIARLKQLLRTPFLMGLFAAWAIAAIAYDGYEFGGWLHRIVG